MPWEAVPLAKAANPGRVRIDVPRTLACPGAAVRWILDHIGAQEPLSIYFGDDRTDEDAFRALPEGLTFKVGCEGATDAKYRVPGPAAVEEFLEWLASQ